MRRLSERRLTLLERRHLVNEPDTGRLMLLLPDLWPDEDQRAWETAQGAERQALVERRTGVRPNLDLKPCWALIVPSTDEMLAMSAVEKAAFLERHETRPIRPGPWE